MRMKSIVNEWWKFKNYTINIEYLLPIINIALFARLANYHSIPATGLLENLYHRSEAATGIDRYNRNLA